jgi:hypothetical protein
MSALSAAIIYRAFFGGNHRWPTPKVSFQDILKAGFTPGPRHPWISNKWYRYRQEGPVLASYDREIFEEVYRTIPESKKYMYRCKNQDWVVICPRK